MKKRILTILVFLFVILIIHQLYWYSKYGGNFMIWVNNSTQNEIIKDVKIYLDGEKIYNKAFGRYNKPDILNIKPGKHNFRIISNTLGIDKEYTFYSILVKRAVIEFYNNEDNKIGIVFFSENIFQTMVFN